MKKTVKKTIKKNAAPVKSKKMVKKPSAKISKSTVSKPAVKAKAKTKATPKPVARPVKSIPSASKSVGLTPSEVKEIKSQLMQMKEDLQKKILEKKSMDMPEAEVGDPIDVATQNLDKEIFFELSGNVYQMMDDTEAALRRIEKGIYGICESCGCQIPSKRIKALPSARYCINCQASNETTPSSSNNE